jgi:hypothetical protein
MREPDYRGVGHWCAWDVPLVPAERRKPDDTTIAHFLLHCPGAHAFWSYWWIALIHLRPIEGVKPAHITTPGAGWEMFCFAQQPEVSPDPDRSEETFRYLIPIDWVVQFGDVRTDHDAKRIALTVVRAIMTGKVSPDQDFRSFWEATIRDTAKHFAAGGHPEN